MSVSSKFFGRTPEGREVSEYVITNTSGACVALLDYGAVIRAIVVPDQDGKPGDVTLGFDTLDEYISNNAYIGAVVGRFGNRIANGRFMLNGRNYELNRNNNGHALHGGPGGFHMRVWDSEIINEQTVRMKYISADKEEGYPGNLTVQLDYSFDDDNALDLEYTVTTDADTIHNITQHAYFNLNGHGSGSILGHGLVICADAITPVSSDESIPTGEIRDIGGTVFDFRSRNIIGEMLEKGKDDEQIIYGKGFDINYVIQSEGYRKCAEVTGDSGGRVMEVFTDQPGVQLYTGNMMTDMAGKSGAGYSIRGALCLETQHFPDSINQAGFPSVVLRAGGIFKSRTMFRFGTC